MRPRANAVVAAAQSQTEHLVRDGYPPDAIRVIANGVADDPPVRDREAVRAELGVAPSAFLAVLVAALRPEKCAAVFVEQVSAAHAIEPSVQGVVVGDGPDAASVGRAVRRSGGAVRMLGYRADAVDIMHAGDVVCLTSAVEALPMSVLEAMSVARPVIATRVGGLPEVVEPGRTGFLISPDRPSELAHALVKPRSRPGARRGTGAGRTGAPKAGVLDRGNDARICGASGRPRRRPPHGRAAATAGSGHSLTDSSRTEAVRVAVLVNSLIVPEWVAWTIARIDAMGAFELAAVVPAADAACRACGGSGTARCAASNFPLVRVGRQDCLRRCPCHARYRPVTDRPWADVLLGYPHARRGRVVPARRAHRLGWSGPPPRSVGDRPHGRWPTYQRVEPLLGASRGHGTATAAVVSARRRLHARDRARLRARRSTVADAHAQRRRVDLRTPRAALPAPAPAGRRPRPDSGRPLASRETCLHRRSPFATRRARRYGAWRPRAARSGAATSGLSRCAGDRRTGVPAKRVRTLPNPAGRYLADPFPIEVDGHHFIFVEDYSHAARRGAISVFEAGPHGAWSPPRRVLECEHHLSYPFVFEHDGRDLHASGDRRSGSNRTPPRRRVSAYVAP